MVAYTHECVELNLKSKKLTDLFNYVQVKPRRLETRYRCLTVLYTNKVILNLRNNPSLGCLCSDRAGRHLSVYASGGKGAMYW